MASSPKTQRLHPSLYTMSLSCERTRWRESPYCTKANFPAAGGQSERKWLYNHSRQYLLWRNSLNINRSRTSLRRYRSTILMLGKGAPSMRRWNSLSTVKSQWLSTFLSMGLDVELHRWRSDARRQVVSGATFTSSASMTDYPPVVES